MANMKHFSDFNGQSVELKVLDSISNKEFADRFPGTKGRRYDGYTMRVGYAIDRTGAMLPVTREIEYKKNPSKHVCNAKCMFATGRIMKCECSCGGKNHGNGGMRCD